MNLLEYVRAVALMVDRHLGGPGTAPLVDRRTPALDRHGTLAQSCAAVVVAAASVGLEEDDLARVLASARTPSVRALARVFLSFAGGSCSEPLPRERFRESPERVWKVVRAFEAYLGALVSRPLAGDHAERPVTLVFSTDRLAQTVLSEWGKRMLHPENVEALDAVLRGLPDDERRALIGEVANEVLKNNVEQPIEFAALLAKFRRDRPKPMVN